MARSYPFSLVYVLAASSVALSALHAQAPDVARQRAALQRACNAGALSPDECQKRLAALNAQSTSGQPAPNSAPPANTQPGQFAPGATQPAGAPTVWHEPHNRYSLTVPAGWQVDTSQGNLKITLGTNWATFDTTSSPRQPADLVRANAGQMQSLVSNWKMVNGGPFNGPNGHPAAGITATADVPTRQGTQQQTFLFTALAAGSGNYVTMTASATSADGRAPIDAIMQSFSSIRFAGEQPQP